MTKHGLAYSSLLVSILFLSLVFPMVIATNAPVVEKGTATIKAADMPSIIGIPQSNIRFALWNGSVWYELPFTVSSGGTQENVTDAQTNETSTVSVLPAAISTNEVFTVSVPGVDGQSASATTWWNTALYTMLFNRELIQLSTNGGYSPSIYVYYSPAMKCCLPPNYSSGALPFVSPVTENSQNDLASAASSSAPATTFYPTSLSQAKPEMYTGNFTGNFGPSDPTVYSVQNVLECDFSSSGTSGTNYFYMPAQSASGTPVLIIYWDTSGAGFTTPEGEVYINGQPVGGITAIAGPGETMIDLPVSGLLKYWSDSGYPENSVYVTLGIQNGMKCLVSLYVYVPYSAASTTYAISSQEYWAQYYSMPTNTGSITYFPTTLPNGLVDQAGGDVVTIGAISPNSTPITLTLTLNYYTTFVTVASWNIGGASDTEYWESYDITNWAVGAPNIGIGISISSSENWGVQGWITSLDRPCVAPDSSSIWSSQSFVHSECINSGSIYFTPQTGANYFAGTYSTEVDERGNGLSPTFYTASSLIPNTGGQYPNGVYWGFTPYYLETQISSQQLENPNYPGWYQPLNFVGTSGGSYIYQQPISQNEGADILTLASGLGLLSPVAELGIYFASIIVTFAGTSSGPTVGTSGTDHNTAYQSCNVDAYVNGNSEPFSMLMTDVPDMNNIGAYTMQFQATIQFYGYGFTPPGEPELTVYNSFTYVS
jgi:hypothetical protein